MKVRIKDSSIRFRLSSSDIKKLYKKGKVASVCKFGSSSAFKYTVISNSKANPDYLCIDLKTNHIKIELSSKDVKEWYRTDLEGFDAEMDNGTDAGLYVLIEKDWQCLEPRDEDESDLYPNPNS
ncbi:MAG: hypothetical protein ACI86M_002712 [Saprospiraceae bacterium]|jgi:hypothetical protein